MRVIADFCLVPMGGDISVSKYIARCELILKEEGFTPKMHSYGTTIQGEWGDVFAAFEKCHQAVHDMGIVRISTSIRCGTRTDRVQTIDEKVHSVEKMLPDGFFEGSGNSDHAGQGDKSV